MTGQASSKFARNVALPFSVGLLLLHLAGVFLVKLSGFAYYYGLIISLSEAVIAGFIVIVALRGLISMLDVLEDEGRGEFTKIQIASFANRV